MNTLLTESLEARLERLLPGATCRRNTGAEVTNRFIVTRAGKVLGTGSTLREAVDRALTLFAVQR